MTRHTSRGQSEPVTGDQLLTARIVAQQLGLCTETVLAWVRAGKLPAIRLPGGAIRIRETELEQWLEERVTISRERQGPKDLV